jgi:hypothetical protein
MCVYQKHLIEELRTAVRDLNQRLDVQLRDPQYEAEIENITL